MGSAASVSSQGDEALIQNFIEFYSQDPTKMDAIIAEGKRRFQAQNASTGTPTEPPPAVSTEGAAVKQDQSPRKQQDSSLVDFNNALTTALNFARVDPLGFSMKHLEPHLKRFVDDSVYEEEIVGTDGSKQLQRIRTREGKTAVLEAIEYCKDKSKSGVSLHGLKPCSYLVDASLAHCQDIGPKGSLEHDGSDGSKTADRVSRYCVWSQCVAENIDFGNSVPIDIVVALIIDDGTPSRGHRTNIFNEAFHYVGGALYPHSIYKHCCVMDFAGAVKDFADVVRHNCEVKCSGSMTEEFKKVLFSIPTKDGDGLKDQLQASLNNGAEVTLKFNYDSSSATIESKQGAVIETMNMTWGAANRAH